MGQAEDGIDAIGLAPGHQGLAGEPAVGAPDDPHPGPAGADPADDPGDLVQGAPQCISRFPPQGSDELGEISDRLADG